MPDCVADGPAHRTVFPADCLDGRRIGMSDILFIVFSELCLDRLSDDTVKTASRAVIGTSRQCYFQ